MSAKREQRPADLLRLAREMGVQTAYVPGPGRRVEASTEALVAVCRLLGAELDSPGAAAAALRAHRRRTWLWQCEPVAVAWDGRPGRLALRMPEAAGGEIDCSLRLEDGSQRQWRVRLDALAVVASGPAGYVQRCLPLPPLPDGYHRLALRARSGGSTVLDAEALVIAAPSRFYERPGVSQRWGVFLPLYALRTGGSWGAGDFSDLEALSLWLAGQGGHLVATLPLLPAFLDKPFQPSPYSPVSRLFWNEFYIDPRRAPGDVSALLQDPAIEAEAGRLRALPLVDYRASMALKRRFLTALSEQAFTGGPSAALRDFLAGRADVREYAAFRAAVERLGPDWRAWPERPRSGHLSSSDYDEAVMRYYAFGQWLARRQLDELAMAARERDQDFYLDLPIGSDPLGYDNWRFREQFVEQVSVGAPPDVLFAGGQDWGFPPLHPEAQRRSAYDHLRRVLGHHLSLASVLRVDHVLGLHRLFWVPRGLPATEGVYVRYPADELYAVYSLESHRHRATIVGENLGTAPREVGASLARHRLYETYVLQFELPVQDGGRVRPPPSNALAGLNTHDMPPFAGYLAGRDISLRRELGLMSDAEAKQERAVRRRQKETLADALRRAGVLGRGRPAPRDLLRAAMGFLRRSRARYVAINLEDAWLETEAQNLPGTSSEYTNWQRKARLPLEDFPSLTGEDGVLAAEPDAPSGDPRAEVAG